MTDLLQRLGQRIRELRNQRGWSQEEFADVCGVHRTYMGHLERGEKNLSFSSIVRVASALHVTVSELFHGLESGELESGASARRGKRPGGVSNADQFRRKGEFLKELAAVERGVRALKKMALETAEIPSRRKPSKKAQ